MKKAVLLLSLIITASILYTSCKKEDSSSCSDGVRNGTETGIDCGGNCSPCAQAATCSDGIQNGNETAVDCGGSCPACPTCVDGVQNGDELGVDCGGSCPPCAAEPTCTDGIQNGDETDVDCGGSCPVCPTCTDGIQNGDETEVDCGGSCPDCPTCTDGIQNGDETGIDCGGSCTACFDCGDVISDIDGNTYNTIEIGAQCWTKENLKVTRYNDGSEVPLVTDGQSFTSLTTHAWAYFNNDISYENDYGKWYNWYAASNPLNLCPSGWHIPTLGEYNDLVSSLGGSDVAGGKMKETGGSYWQAPNVGATNSSGFSGRAGGTMWSTQPPGGTFGNFWTQTADSNNGYGMYFYLFYNGASAASTNSPGNRGYSCRCVKD